VGNQEKPDIAYQLRNRLHQVEGKATEKEILKKIASGKFTGEEEIAAPPYERWQKLASHPTFYDAFLKRLYHKDYAAATPDFSGGEASEPSKPESQSDDRATRQAGAAGGVEADAQDLPDSGGKTQNLGGERDFGATLHQSFIDELFSNSGMGSGKKALEGAPESPGTDVVQNEDSPLVPVPMDEPLDFGKKVQEEEALEVIQRKKAKDRRRIAIWISLLLLFSVLLFQMGKSDKTVDAKEENAKEENAKETAAKVVSPPILGDLATKEEKVRTLVEEGDRLYENDTPLFYLGAQELFSEALSYDEDNVAILGRLAEATARLLPESSESDGLDGQIKQTLGKGRASDPQFSQFFRAEALQALTHNHLEEAKAAIHSASEADPGNPENALVLGEIFYTSGDLVSAKMTFEQVAKTNPYSVRCHHYLAQIALDQKDLSRARAEAMETLKLNPIHGGTYYLLARLEAEQGHLKEAKQLYETTGGLAPFSAKREVGRAYYRLGLLQEQAKDPQGTKSFQLSLYYTPEMKSTMGDKLKATDSSDKKLRELADASEYGRPYYDQQAENLVTREKFRESLIFFEATYLLQPNDGTALVRLGEVSEKLAVSYEDFRTVVGFYQRAIERDPSLTRAYLKLGLLETDLYNLERAYRLLKQAEALSPQDAEPYVALGKHFYKAKDYFAAIEQFTKAYNINPSNSEILYYAGLLRLLGKNEGEKEAVNYFYRAYTLDPNNYDALVEWLKLKVGGYDKNFAVKFMRALLEKDPKSPQLYWAMGEVYAADKEFRRAINYFHNSLDLDNRSTKVRMALGKSLEAVGEVEKAIAEYRLASFLDPRNGEGFYRAADLLFQLRSYRESEEMIRYLINVSPNYPGAHRYLSMIYQVRKQKDEAIAAMQKEVQNNPMNAKFRIEFAELLMGYEKVDQAITELTEVTNLPPISKAPEFAYEKIRAYLLLTRCYRAQGKLESAEGTVRLALETDPEDPELHRELGFVLKELQRDNSAVKEFEFYLSRNPAAQDSGAIKALIQQLQIDD
jgi:tetratricopeptide (TPR) repeat protein